MYDYASESLLLLTLQRRVRHLPPYESSQKWPGHEPAWLVNCLGERQQQYVLAFHRLIRCHLRSLSVLGISPLKTQLMKSAPRRSRRRCGGGDKKKRAKQGVVNRLPCHVTSGGKTSLSRAALYRCWVTLLVSGDRLKLTDRLGSLA